MAATVSSDLQALLGANNVPREVQDAMATLGCTTVKIFANWVESRSEIQEHLLNACAAHRANRAALAGLKQAWREADALISRGVKRGMEGLSEEALDDPLPHPVQTLMEKEFTDHYHFELEPRFQGSDSLVGRLKREADKRSPSMFSVTRVRSLAHANKVGDPKRHRLAESLLLELDDPHALLDDSSADRLRTRLYQYTVLANTWALTGCCLVDTPTGKVAFCTWPEAIRYVQMLRDKSEHLIDKYSESSVVSYLLRTEEDLRAKAIELARKKTDPISWGQALERVAKDYSHLWQDNKDALRGSRPTKERDPPKGGREQGRDRRDTRRRTPEPRRQPPPPATPEKRPRVDKLTATHLGKIPLCKPWNDSRGCQKVCPKGDVHGCDILLDSGKACGSKDHTRQQHDSGKHGEAARRR